MRGRANMMWAAKGILAEMLGNSSDRKEKVRRLDLNKPTKMGRGKDSRKRKRRVYLTHVFCLNLLDAECLVSGSLSDQYGSRRGWPPTAF